MRIMHVIEAFGGGTYEIVRTLAERLADRGDDVLIAYGLRPETPDDLTSKIDSRVALAATWNQRGLREQLPALHRLRRTWHSFEPDIVHLHSSFAGVAGALVLPETPTVYTPQAYSFTMSRGSRVQRLAYLQLERFVARRVTLIGAASRSEAELARNVVRARRVETVCNGIPELDPGATRAPTKPPGRPRVMALGRTVRQRRPVEAAAILSAVADTADVEWVGGAYPRSVGLRALEEAGIPITGWMPHDEVMRRLSMATAYLHWTEWDGLPLSLLEAMAMDAVVVASDIPPNREVLGPEQVCRDEAEAKRLLRRILTDHDFRQSLLGRQRALRGYYSEQRVVDEWSALYRRLRPT